MLLFRRNLNRETWPGRRAVFTIALAAQGTVAMIGHRSWILFGLIALSVPVSLAWGQGHEPPGKELHPSYVLYYGPGDGTVRTVDPESGNASDPIFASVQGRAAFVHWFTYDWPGNKMYVAYSDNSDGTLLLGTVELHQWHISPIAAIDTTANFGLLGDFFTLQGLAYSQVTGMLYMNFGTNQSQNRGVISLDPQTGKLALDSRFFNDFGNTSAHDTGHAMSNDPAGNLRYDFTESGNAAGLTSFRTYVLSDVVSRQYQRSDIYPVNGVNGALGDEATLSPRGWSTCVEVFDFYALAVEPETGEFFVVSGGSGFAKGLSKLAYFSVTWNPDHPFTIQYAYAESINENLPIESSGKGLSFVFVPWQE